MTVSEPGHPTRGTGLLLAAPWLPVLVAAPAFLLLPGLAAVAAVFAAWALTFLVLSRLLERIGLVIALAGVSSSLAVGILVLEVAR